MLLPNNGRIVIVDDDINEAQPLMNILSKKRIPFNYYSGTKISDFPESPDENKLRVLFLDLNIFEQSKDAKTVISSINAILNRIIPNNPSPYLLVIWSKQNDEYKTALEGHFKNVIPHKSPAKIIFLRKGNYFDYIDGSWQQKQDSISNIESDLNDQLNDISFLRNLISWENIVHNSTTETINEFSSIYPIDNNWDKKIKVVMFHLAKTVIGNTEINSSSDNSKLLAAFSNLNSFLSERIQTSIEEKSLGDISDIKDEVWEKDPKRKQTAIEPFVSSLINSKLHLTKKVFTENSFSQGHIYFIRKGKFEIKNILWKDKYDGTFSTKIIESKPRLIALDLTPVCDYSQDKNYIRTIYGLLITSKYFDKIPNSDYQVKTPILLIENVPYFFLFDFRFIMTATKSEFIKMKMIPKYKLRREICTDLQSQLSNQLNRPGISNL
ncbi:MAG: hypothetical protein L6Q77_15630 [Bacteroidetes bacterium]|nr:hypothetical protein [Bacteroidota bacterium]